MLQREAPQSHRPIKRFGIEIKILSIEICFEKSMDNDEARKHTIPEGRGPVGRIDEVRDWWLWTWVCLFDLILNFSMNKTFRE